jgi:hypothetical protein
VTIALERPVGATDPLTLLTPDLADRLTRRITTDHPEIGEATARRVVGQAAAFVVASGRQSGQSMAPSLLVDFGWHAFILHTVDYADFCQRVVGRFVHHVPTGDDEQLSGSAEAARERTLAAIRTAGYTVDDELWATAADCNQCHAGCHDSPKSG